MTRRVLLSWSSGKDAAWTLQVLRGDPDVEVVGLLTTVNTTHGRVAMHATRRALLEAQARAADLPLYVIPLPWPCPDEVYEREMRAAVEAALGRGVTHVAFGDLFLEDIRAYRTRQLEGTGLEPLFPLWHEPTGPLSRRIVDAGVEAFVSCVDPDKLSRSFAGRRYDHAFLDQLPHDVDPCGENGEFHTCVLAGPMFSERVVADVGEVVERDGFVFADVVPAGSEGDAGLALKTAAGLWSSFLASRLPGAASATGARYTAWHFGTGGSMADELVELVLNGSKRATAGALWSYEHEVDPLPRAGDYSVILDGAGRARCVIRTTSVDVIPFSEVDDDFAAAEGEGDLSLDSWRRDHWHFFIRELAAFGRTPEPDMPVVCERFELVYPLEDASC